MNSAERIAKWTEEQKQHRQRRQREAAEQAKADLLDDGGDPFAELEAELGRRLTPAEKLAALAKANKTNWEDLDGK